MRKLTTEHHLLKNWLEQHHINGHYWTIEDIVENVRDKDGNPIFRLNTNPRIHDKCVRLSKMIKELNYATNVERYIPIVKDKKGSCKLAESKQELEDFIKSEKKKVENANKYANHLQGLIEINDTMPLVNLANRVKNEGELEYINIYRRDQ